MGDWTDLFGGVLGGTRWPDGYDRYMRQARAAEEYHRAIAQRMGQYRPTEAERLLAGAATQNANPFAAGMYVPGRSRPTLLPVGWGVVGGDTVPSRDYLREANKELADLCPEAEEGIAPAREPWYRRLWLAVLKRLRNLLDRLSMEKVG